MPVGVDPTNAAMVVLVGVGQIVTWIVMFRSGRKSEIRDAADKAAQQTAESAGIKDLAKANGQIAEALEKLSAWTQAHEISDARWQSSAEQILKQHAETQSRIAGSMENLQRQLTNLALGLAPTEATPIPSTRGRR